MSLPSDPIAAAPYDQRPTQVRWLILAMACGASWFLYLHRYTFNFIRPQLEKEYGFNNTQLDSIFTAFNVSYAVGQIPGGVVCDFFGPHLFLGIIIALWSLLLPAVGLTGSFSGLSGIRLAFGAAQAGCYPGLAKVTKEWFPLRIRTVLQGLVASFFGRSGGAMSSIIMGSLLMGLLGFSWRLALVVMAAAGVLFAVLFLLLVRNRPEDDARVNPAERELIREGEVAAREGPPLLPLRRALRNRSLLVFIVQQFINAGADSIYVYLMGSYFMSQWEFDVTTAGLLVSLPLWGGAVGGVAGGLVNDGLIRLTGSRRWSRAAAGVVGKLLACLVMFVAVAQTSGLAAAGCLFVVKFFSDWTQPTVWGTCTDMGGRYSATVFSIINTAGSAGAIVTPPLLGLVLDYYTTTEIGAGGVQRVTDYSPIFNIVAVMYLFSAACWFCIDCTNSIERQAAGGGKPE